MTHEPLLARFVEHDRSAPALIHAGATWSYGDLSESAASIAATALAHTERGRIGVYGRRSPEAYAGALAVLMGGSTYVPLSTALPPSRTAYMLERSGADTIIVAPEAVAMLPDVLKEVTGPITVIAPWSPVGPAAGARVVDRLLPASDFRPIRPGAQDLAWIVFTSGSTGTPKAIGATHANARTYLDACLDRYGITSSDRMTQMYEPVFDPSIHDMFMAWHNGATLVAPTTRELLKPARFVRDMEATSWFSVPSVAILMRRLNQLTPGAFPTLRWALFCGEPLPLELAATMQAAAPNAHVENLYGPTEVTVLATVHRWSPEDEGTHNGVTPIGRPFPGTDTTVVDEHGERVDDGQVGELLLGGRQVTPGYLGDPERTAAAFIERDGSAWYRTGDLAVQEPDGPLVYHGRADHQIKVKGNRIELGEIEAALRTATARDTVVALGWPETETGFGGVVGFVAGAPFDEATVRASLAQELAGAVVPSRVIRLDEMPLNVNGKFDRNQLRDHLREGQG